MTKKLADQKLTKKEKDERILFKKNEVSLSVHEKHVITAKAQGSTSWPQINLLPL